MAVSPQRNTEFLQFLRHFGAVCAHFLNLGDKTVLPPEHSRGTATKVSHICSRSSTILGFDRKYFCLAQSHEKKPHVIRSALDEGHFVGPSRPVHRPQLWPSPLTEVNT